MIETAELKDIIGKTMLSVVYTGDEIVFITTKGEKYKLYHSQYCGESVGVEDVIGDLSDLEDSPIVMAEEIDNDMPKLNDSDESYTWTFYKFATAKGYVTIRFYGTSNGYYSEGVDFVKYD